MAPPSSYPGGSARSVQVQRRSAWERLSPPSSSAPGAVWLTKNFANESPTSRRHRTAPAFLLMSVKYKTPSGRWRGEAWLPGGVQGNHTGVGWGHKALPYASSGFSQPPQNARLGHPGFQNGSDACGRSPPRSLLPGTLLLLCAGWDALGVTQATLEALSNTCWLCDPEPVP